MGAEAQTLTQLLAAWREGDESALALMLPSVYDELHRLAAGFMRRERSDHTLRPTELVAEAYMRLVGGCPDVRDRVHFFAVAARVMRQILVDHARRRAAGKRGGLVRPIALDDDLIASSRPEQLLELDQALLALAGFDERKARAVELHYFGGMTQDEIAQVLGVHANTIARDLRLAVAWIHQQLREPGA